MRELIVNLHIHTTYSDGFGTHAEILMAALKTGLDVIVVTDHNILLNNLEGYHQTDNHMVLMLIGEEVHDRTRRSQKNHLLVFGVDREMTVFASHSQQLIDQVSLINGLSFIAHPYDPSLPIFREPDISWVEWNIHNYTGIELWNGFSEFKNVIHNKLEAIFYAYFPQFIAHAPLSKTLGKWDELLANGKPVVAVGGSDAHALQRHMGPLHRIIFPYEFHFRCINTHLLTPNPLSGELSKDRSMVLNALRQGHAFIGYDLPVTTRGFRFAAQGKEKTAIMGDTIHLHEGVTFQIRLPVRTECRLIKNGQIIKTWQNREICTYFVNHPGVYRVECYISYLGKQRGWIFSNPIYVRSNTKILN